MVSKANPGEDQVSVPDTSRRSWKPMGGEPMKISLLDRTSPRKGNVSVRNSFDLLANLEVIEEERVVTVVQTERKEVRNGVFPRAALR